MASLQISGECPSDMYLLGDSSHSMLFWDYVITLKIYFNVKYIWSHLYNTSLSIDYPVESCKILVILFGSMLPNLKGH